MFLDPTEFSLFYFALGKVRLVQGLWRQASWHPESNLMLKLLSNDFGQARWRTAALKNAFDLLGKRRNGMFDRCAKLRLTPCPLTELAAAFFLFGWKFEGRRQRLCEAARRFSTGKWPWLE
jgi:hypothetical protein